MYKTTTMYYKFTYMQITTILLYILFRLAGKQIPPTVIIKVHHLSELLLVEEMVRHHGVEDEAQHAVEDEAQHKVEDEAQHEVEARQGAEDEAPHGTEDPVHQCM